MNWEPTDGTFVPASCDGTPASIGTERLFFHTFKTAQGNRGRVPKHDRKLALDGRLLSFEEFLVGVYEDRWNALVVHHIIGFFFRNEAAIYPCPPYRGAGMLREALDILRHEGLEDAMAYVERMKPGSPRPVETKPNGPCEGCGRPGVEGFEGEVLCIPCWWKARRAA